MTHFNFTLICLQRRCLVRTITRDIGAGDHNSVCVLRLSIAYTQDGGARELYRRTTAVSPHNTIHHRRAAPYYACEIGAYLKLGSILNI